MGCPGCRSKERMPDSELWQLFNTSGRELKAQAEHEAQAMGLNGRFEEFVPVRYAVQRVSGQRFFVKVRVQPQLFIDVLIFRSFSPNDRQPMLQAIRVSVDDEARADEKAPIDDFESPPTALAAEIIV